MFVTQSEKRRMREWGVVIDFLLEKAIRMPYELFELICARVCDRHDLMLRVDDLQGTCLILQRHDRLRL